MIVDYPLTEPPLEALPRGVRTNLYASISVAYGGLSRRRRLIFSTENDGRRLKLQRNVLIYPRQCTSPIGKAGEHVITKCGDGKIVQICTNSGEWKTLINQCEAVGSKLFMLNAKILGIPPNTLAVLDGAGRITIVAGIIFLVWYSRKAFKHEKKR